jgi:hypothetical protein
MTMSEIRCHTLTRNPRYDVFYLAHDEALSDKPARGLKPGSVVGYQMYVGTAQTPKAAKSMANQASKLFLDHLHSVRKVTESHTKKKA